MENNTSPVNDSLSTLWNDIKKPFLSTVQKCNNSVLHKERGYKADREKRYR